MIGEIVYRRVPESWSEKAWREAGAFVAVFLNFNKLAMIRRSVASALAQDYSALEILFMDDASTDGSAEVMEEMVRAYRGPHKVTVVRNRVNAGICGQWNQVTELSGGEWFGMFCGDDVAHPDRVTQAAKVVRRYPGLLGLSASMDTFDFRSGEPCDYPGYPPEVIEMRGNERPDILYARRWASGCTAFWRREIFARPLPDVALDDLFIHWRLLMTARGREDVVWVYDGNCRTIDYSVGAGLWSEIRSARDPSMPKPDFLRRRHASEVKVWNRCRDVWRAILDEAVAGGEAFSEFAALAKARIVDYRDRVALAETRLRELDMPQPFRFVHKALRKLGLIRPKGNRV